MSEKSLRLIVNAEDPYTHVPNTALRDTKMPLAVRGFFALLLGLPRDRDHSLKYFVRVAGVNKDTVCRYFRILEENGYLKRYQERAEHGAFGTNVYELYASPYPKKPDTVKPETVEPETVEPETVNPDTKELTSKNNNPLEPPKGGRSVPEPAKWKPERFEDFWTYYRTHVNPANRAAARKAWDKLKPDDEMISAIAKALLHRLKVDDEWARGFGRPHASTYLNGKAWLDDAPVAPSQLPQLTPERQEGWGWEE